MGSTFVEYGGRKTGGGLFSDKESVPVFLQFVPGIVLSVVTSQGSADATGSPYLINSIVALPHISNKVNSSEKTANETHRYIPLMRGMVDVPAKGDQVLLCTIGKINYYLGPLNTQNNPNFNIDRLYTSKNSAVANLFGSEGSPESDNFVKNGQLRLQKPFSPLDLPIATDGYHRPAAAIRQNHGDMMFEGRHGNSIRIGSRVDKPYIYFSNGRGSTSPIESLGDGSIISMTSYGSLRQHFPRFQERISEEDMRVQNGFVFGSDISEPKREKVRHMRDLIDSMEITDEKDSGIPAYGWRGNQILITSDRVTINSDTDNVHISSHRNLHMGAGENLSISTNQDMVIESRNIYLGVKAYELNNESDESKKRKNKPEPLVLGEALTELLNDLVDILQAMNFINPAGVATPLIDSAMAFVGQQPGAGRKSLKDIKDKIESIKSYYHYIEPNNEPNKEVIKAQEQ